MVIHYLVLLIDHPCAKMKKNSFLPLKKPSAWKRRFLRMQDGVIPTRRRRNLNTSAAHASEERKSTPERELLIPAVLL